MIGRGVDKVSRLNSGIWTDLVDAHDGDTEAIFGRLDVAIRPAHAFSSLT